MINLTHRKFGQLYEQEIHKEKLVDTLVINYSASLVNVELSCYRTESSQINSISINLITDW